MSRRSKRRTCRDQSPRRGKKRRPPTEFRVYVVLLDESVWTNRRFRQRNPVRDASRPCVYVGSTAHTPAHRFEQHTSGHRTASRLVRRYGRHLLEDRTLELGPVTRDEAVAREEELAEQLRALGWAAWQN